MSLANTDVPIQLVRALPSPKPCDRSARGPVYDTTLTVGLDLSRMQLE